MDLLTSYMTGALQASTPGPTDDYWYNNFNGVMTAAGFKVDAEGARKISAWYRGRDILGTSVAMIPLHMYRRLADGDREAAPGHPLDDILDRMANAGTDAFQFKRQMIFDVIDYGWHYSFIISGGRGFVDQLHRIDPTTVTPELITDGPLKSQWKFTVRDPKTGQSKVYRQDQIFYLRGVDGKGILEYARDSLGLGLVLENYASKIFSKGSLNAGYVETPGSMPDSDAMRRFAAQFGTEFGMWHFPKVIPFGAKFATGPVLEPEKAQMILSRKFSVIDIARWLGLPAHMLNEVDTAGVTGLEQKGQEFVTFNLGGWLAMVEFAVNSQLVLAKQYFAEFTRDALAIGDLDARWEAYSTGVNAGIMTPNEARRKENLKAMPDGDKLREPQNITGKGAKGGPQDNQRPGRKGDPDDKAQAIVVSAAARVLQLEVTAVQRLAVKHAADQDAFAAAIAEFYAGHVARVVDILRFTDAAAAGYCAGQSSQVLGGWMAALDTFKSEDYAHGLAAWALESEAA